MISVAVERDAEDARPWIEAADPTHPALVDTQHVLADLYNMVNVPTVLWIDERGRIVRPNDVAFTTERGGQFANVSTEAQMAMLRAWVRGEAQPNSAGRLDLQPLPTPAEQLARAHFGLGNWLYHQGRGEAAVRHFKRGGELAPHDFMIRRGSMPMQGVDPFGDEFMAMMRDWVESGNKYYEPLPTD